MEEDSDRKIRVPADLGMRLTDWHSSMYDPIYSISSCTIAGEMVYESTFRRALANMEGAIGHEAHEEHQQEVLEIVAAMKAVLGESEIRTTIINAMARYLWASAWADVMEERGDPPRGEVTHLAPTTPPQAVEHARNLLEKFEKLNDTTIEKVVESEKPDDVYDYGGVVAGNFLGFGIDSMGDYETPWCETSELWDLVPEG